MLDPALQLALDDVVDDAHPVVAVVEAGDIGELLAAVCRKISRFSTSISSSVSRQSAEKPGATMAMRFTPLRPAPPRSCRCRAAAIRLVPNRDWKVMGAVARASRGFAQQPRGLLAVAMIGIAVQQIVLRHAVEGDDDDLRLEIEPREVAASWSAERLDVDRIVVIGRHTRSAGCQRMSFSARKAWSQAVAVVAAAYCG